MVFSDSTKFFKTHLRKCELDKIAELTGAELVMLPRGHGEHAGEQGGGGKRHAGGKRQHGLQRRGQGEHAESTQLYTRSGNSKEDGQMWMKMPARSGEYAICIRYKSVGVGVDTDKWKVVIDDAAERWRRHQATLSALRDQLLSPEGALTATLLPHLAGLVGAIAVRSSERVICGQMGHAQSPLDGSCARFHTQTGIAA